MTINIYTFNMLNYCRKYICQTVSLCIANQSNNSVIFTILKMMGAYIYVSFNSFKYQFATKTMHWLRNNICFKLTIPTLIYPSFTSLYCINVPYNSVNYLYHNLLRIRDPLLFPFHQFN